MKWEVRTMRSGTSFFNWTVFKKNILRFWPVWAAYSAIWFIAMPLDALMMLQLEAANRQYPDAGGFLERFARNAVPGMTEVSLFMAVVFGALAAMAVCSHLYNAKSANLFGALPIRREGQFLTHYLAGLAFLIVPNVVVFLLTLVIEAAGGAVFMSELLFWLWVTCGESLFFYSMAVFCGMFTGHILALPAFYGIFNALAAALYYLLRAVFDSFYYGFGGFENGVSGFVAWLTPVLKLARGIGVYSYGYGDDLIMAERFEGEGIVAVYAIVAVVLAVGSFFLDRARRLESAGEVVSVRCMRPVFKYSVAVCSGLFFGMLTAQIVYMHEPGLMISMVAWAVVGYFVAQMLLDKTFKVFHKWKGGLAVVGAFVLMFLVVGFDLTGYETRVPTADQVESVQIYGLCVNRLGDDGDFLDAVTHDPELIEGAILLHQAAVDRRDADQPAGMEGAQMNLTYHLKSGSTLTRSYTIWVDTTQAEQEGSAAWAIQQIYDDRDLYWTAYGFEEAERRMAEEGYRLDEVQYVNGNGEFEDNVYYAGKDAQALYEAVKEDFKAGRIGVRKVDGQNNWGEQQRELDFQFVGSGKVGSGTRNWWIRIYVQDTASSTLAVLERLAAQGAGDRYESSDRAPYTVWTDGGVGMEPVPTDVPVPTAEPYPAS